MRMNHKKEFIEMENEEKDKKGQNNLLGFKESAIPKIGEAFRIGPQIINQQSKDNIMERRSKNQIITDTIRSKMTKTGTHFQIGKKKRCVIFLQYLPKKGLESNVFIHIQKTHQGKSLPCKLCGKLERSQFAMKTHMGKMHPRKNV